MHLRHRPAERTSEREQMDRLRADFISTASHELRTPVTTLRGAALTLVRHPELDDETKSYLLEMIDVQSGRLCDLVEELLVAAAVRARAVSPSMSESVDLIVVLHDLLDAAPVGQEAALISDIDHAPVLGAYADVRRIVGAVLAQAGSNVRVRLSSRRRCVRLTVEGAALDENPEQVLEPFARRAGPDKPSDDGLALSLFIAKELARGLGGRLRAGDCALVLELPLADVGEKRRWH